jgi:8-oxo-dGTP pyrophosphatase MutT (NUDIX family)
MRYDEVIRKLHAAFQHELPGPSAHAALAPRPRREWPAGFNPARIRNAAGLLLVFPGPPVPTGTGVGPDRDRTGTGLGPDWDRTRTGPGPDWDRTGTGLGPESEAAHIVLTVRADTLGRHGGQISLPGGVVDPGETFEQAAIREAHEEIALAPDDVEVIGALTPLDIPVSGFRLHPIVATARHRPTLRAADGEVAAILEIDLDELTHPSAIVEHSRRRDGVPMTVPGFHIRSVEIWGATGMVLAEFLMLLGWQRPPRS